MFLTKSWPAYIFLICPDANPEATQAGYYSAYILISYSHT